MPPNNVVTQNQDPENFAQNNGKQGSIEDQNYKLRIFQSSITLLAHILIGATLAVALAFAFRGGLPLSATNLHIVLCVTGYHLLMSQAILSQSPNTDWSSRLRLVDKRRAHWILQILGSGLAIIGTFVKIMDKSSHWTSIHGQFGLVALVFTSVSLVNGFASLWATELRKVIPPTLSKITHICFGTVAFCAASITLCYGLEKGFFRGWATDPIAYTIIGFIAFYTFVIIINPLINFFNKAKGVFKNE